MRETLDLDDVDELKEGDRLVRSGLVTQEVMNVRETDVLDEMHVPTDDGPERKYTAGVEVRDGNMVQLVSYRMIVHRGFKVSRSWEDLTDEQVEIVRGRDQ